jgi:MYXO-CTERM domain-containing protein
MKSKSVSTRPASLQPQPLAAYLAGAVGSTFLVSAPQAEAAVTSVTFDFGSVLSDGVLGTYFRNSYTTPSLGGLFAVGHSNIGLGNAAASTHDYSGSYHNAEFSSGYGTARFFASGTVIGNGLNGAIGCGYFGYSNPTYSNLNITSNQLNKNIGFKTTTGNWGWANVSWDATAKALTINSAYVESVANTPITVGDIGAVPEPSSALLALAGLGTAALHRRRKQAA